MDTTKLEIKEIIDLISSENEDKIEFNKLKKESYEDFLKKFNKLSEGEQELFLIQIIESLKDEELMDGNYKKFFEIEKIVRLLRAIC